MTTVFRPTNLESGAAASDLGAARRGGRPPVATAIRACNRRLDQPRPPVRLDQNRRQNPQESKPPNNFKRGPLGQRRGKFHYKCCVTLLGERIRQRTCWWAFGVDHNRNNRVELGKDSQKATTETHRRV